MTAGRNEQRRGFAMITCLLLTGLAGHLVGRWQGPAAAAVTTPEHKHEAPATGVGGITAERPVRANRSAPAPGAKGGHEVQQTLQRILQMAQESPAPEKDLELHYHLRHLLDTLAAADLAEICRQLSTHELSEVKNALLRLATEAWARQDGRSAIANGDFRWRSEAFEAWAGAQPAEVLAWLREQRAAGVNWMSSYPTRPIAGMAREHLPLLGAELPQFSQDEAHALLGEMARDFGHDRALREWVLDRSAERGFTDALRQLLTNWCFMEPREALAYLNSPRIPPAEREKLELEMVGGLVYLRTTEAMEYWIEQHGVQDLPPMFSDAFSSWSLTNSKEAQTWLKQRTPEQRAALARLIPQWLVIPAE